MKMFYVEVLVGNVWFYVEVLVCNMWFYVEVLVGNVWFYVEVLVCNVWFYVEVLVGNMWFWFQGARVWLKEDDQYLPSTVSTCSGGVVVMVSDYGQVRLSLHLHIGCSSSR